MTSTGKNHLHLTTFDSPLGKIIAGATPEGLCILEFNESVINSGYTPVLKILDAEITDTSINHLDILKFELKEYFEGKSKEFSVPVVMTGTEFQQKVWTVLQQIPFGTIQTYKQQAINLNHPEAIRAMAHANGQNRMAIIIPCHRVVGTNGKLTGYSGGLWRKKWLLEHERINSPLGTRLF